MVPKPIWRSVQGNKIACQKCLTIFFPPRVPPGGRRFNIFHQVSLSFIVQIFTNKFVTSNYEQSNTLESKTEHPWEGAHEHSKTLFVRTRTRTVFWKYEQVCSCVTQKSVPGCIRNIFFLQTTTLCTTTLLNKITLVFFLIAPQNSEHKPLTSHWIGCCSKQNSWFRQNPVQYSKQQQIVKLKIKIISPSPQGSETTIRSNSRSQTSSWNFISSSQHLDCAFHLKPCLSSCTHNTRAKNRGRFILSLSSISFLHKSYSKK
jgi:hypothetical protein